MTEEEKAAVRDKLGPAYFLAVAAGVCPYCEKPLVPVPASWPTAIPGGLACVDCESAFGPVEMGGGYGGDDDLDDGDEESILFDPSLPAPQTLSGEAQRKQRTALVQKRKAERNRRKQQRRKQRR